MSLSEEQLQLAHELVDDVELSRLPAEQTLLKALRLARLLEDEEAQEWLRYELRGYPDTPKSRLRMKLFGRFIDEEKGEGYWAPLAGIAGTISAMQTQIQTLRVPDINFAPSSANPQEFIGGYAGTTALTMVQPVKDVLNRLKALTNNVVQMSCIRSRVVAAVHDFAVGAYHRLAFSGLAESIFEKHRREVDDLMRSVAPEALDKIPAVYERLSTGVPEAISQGMNSLRRIIKSVADRVYPASDHPVNINGKKYEVDADKVLNRISLFLKEHCPSKSRRDRLNHSLREIYERASTGVHAEINATEAQALFLGTYLIAGEVLGFADKQNIEDSTKT
jgi:hypothetical protein